MAHVNLKEEYTLGWVANIFQSLNCGISPLVNIHSDLKSVLVIEELDIFYPLAECDIGPSRMRALPLAAGINVGGHYFRHIIPLFVSLVTTVVKIPQGVVVGFQIFAWAPN